MVGSNIVLQFLVSGFLTVITPFAIPLTCDDLDYCCTNENETKGTDFIKDYWNTLGFSQQRKIKVSFRSKNPWIMFDDINML